MAEQRCTDLDANCLCSEPFQMTAFDSGPDFWNPNDTATLECGVEGADNDAPIVRTTSTVTVSSDATALAAFPSGHTVARFVRQEEGGTGTFYVGAGDGLPSPDSSFVRVAARFYRYFSPNFQFKGEGSCDNSKFIQGNGWNTDMDVGGNIHLLNTLDNFTPNIDCCASGPGPDSAVDYGDLKGTWQRIETVITNREGPDFRVEIFMKDVTNDGPELTVIDLWDNATTDNLTPDAMGTSILMNGHRSGTCEGWSGVSHYLYAGWTSNAGQRIGAASEIEDGEEPAAPTKLTMAWN